MSKRLAICVICSANELDKKYTEPACDFATNMAKSGFDLIWGGSNVGLMKAVATAAQQAGGKIFGVSVEYLKYKARPDADEMIIAKTLEERKELMFGRADIIVMMVGGVGTLDEMTEILEHKKHGHHNKPIVILNSAHFYDGLLIQLKRMETDGFLVHPVSEYMYFADTPSEALAYISNYSKKLNLS